MIAQPLHRGRTSQRRQAGVGILLLLLLLAAFVGIQVCYFHAAATFVTGLADIARGVVPLLPWLKLA